MKIKSRSNPDVTLRSGNCLLPFSRLSQAKCGLGYRHAKRGKAYVNHLSNKQNMDCVSVFVLGQFISCPSL